MTGQEIADSVNEIIRGLNPKDFKGPANWSNLQVRQIDEMRSLWPKQGDGGTIIKTVVTIGEASPEAFMLCLRILQAFREKHGYPISVKSEW